MVDDSPATRPHTGLPMAPHLRRSMRFRRALHLKQPTNPPTSRPAPSRRRRFWGNVFMFSAAQLLIAVVAFVLVRDYMDDGYFTHAVSGIWNQSAGEGNGPKIDRDVAIAVEPPAAPVNNEIAAVQEAPAPIEPVNLPPAETQKQVVSVPPQVKEQITAPVVEREPVPPPAAQVATPAIAPEPVPPPVAQVATPAIAPEAALKAADQVAAVAPIPDLTPLANAPAATVPSDSTKPKQTEGQAFRDCATCPELVMISPGQFLMGPGSEGAGANAAPTVAIAAPFAIGRYEITFDEWGQCVGDGGCTSEPVDENWGRGRRPVINVSFNDITQQYLPWLSRKTGFTYRLPTEAEWEFAARGGASAPAGKAYSFGDDKSLLCEYGNSSDLAAKTSDINWTGINCNDGYATTAPVGSLKPNALGLFDMHGNVWEWTADCWHPQYSARPVTSADACDSRVLRGGSWASDAAALRTAVRGWERQDRSKNSIGFRVARSQP